MHTWCWVLFVTLSVAHEDKRLKESAQLLFEFHKWWKKAAEQIRATVNETGRKIDVLVRETSELIKSEVKSFKMDTQQNSTVFPLAQFGKTEILKNYTEFEDEDSVFEIAENSIF